MRARVIIHVGRAIKDKSLHRSEGYRRRRKGTTDMERVKATSALPVIVPESAESAASVLL